MMKRMMWCWTLAFVCLTGCDGKLELAKGGRTDYAVVVDRTAADEVKFVARDLANVLRKVAEDFRGELVVTENGLGTADDSRRVEFIRRALEGVRGCLEDGLPVRGYFHWSLLDNFEWQKGFAMTFGLIAVDRSTMERLPKPSLRFLGSQR